MFESRSQEMKRETGGAILRLSNSEGRRCDDRFESRTRVSSPHDAIDRIQPLPSPRCSYSHPHRRQRRVDRTPEISTATIILMSGVIERKYSCLKKALADSLIVEMVIRSK
jgi:hypothetical protein